MAFGRDADWLTIATVDRDAVVRALALRTVLPANWQAGLAEVRDVGTFVSPPLRGAVFVTGADLQRLEPDADVLPLLQRLSRQFGRVSWCRSDGGRDRFGWALAAGGEVLRAYAYDGEHGHVLWHGDVTAAERELGCFLDDPRDRSDDDVKWWPDRRIVHALAAAFAVDPDTLAGLPANGSIGAVGRL